MSSANGNAPTALANTTIDEDIAFTTEAVEQTAAQIETMYTSIIDDTMTFADNPDLALRESRQMTMTAYAEDLAGQFQLSALDLHRPRGAWNLSCDRERSRGCAPLSPSPLTGLGCREI